MHSGLRPVIAIPISLASKRLPRKAVQDIGGEPLAVRTIKQALKCEAAGSVVAVCDSNEAAEYVSGLCDAIVDNRRGIWCGTKRIAMAMQRTPGLFPAQRSETAAVVNWQVDEPFVKPDDIARLITKINWNQHEKDPVEVCTLVAPFANDIADTQDPNTVKAIIPCWKAKCKDRALVTQFTRQPIHEHAYHHIGVYAFPACSVVKLGTLPQSRRSKREKLEQLTWMDAGVSVHSIKTDAIPLGINTEEDLERAKKMVTG